MKFNLTASQRLEIPKFERKKVILFAVAITIIASFFSLTQILGLSPDYDSYQEFFDLARAYGLDVIEMTRFEPAFVFTTLFLNLFLSSNIGIYTTFVAVCCLIKGGVFFFYSEKWQIFLLVSIFYFIRYFSLYELTQIRVSVAIAFLILGCALLWAGKLKTALLVFGVASVFHTAAFMLLPVIFLRPQKRFHVLALLVLIFIFLKFVLPLFIYGFQDNVEVLAMYEKLGYGGEGVTIFNPSVILDLTLILVAFANWKKITPMMRWIIFFEAVGIDVYYGLPDFAFLAHRLHEVITVFWVFFIIDGLKKNILRTEIVIYMIFCLGVYSYLFFFRGEFFLQ